MIIGLKSTNIFTTDSLKMAIKEEPDNIEKLIRCGVCMVRYSKKY